MKGVNRREFSALVNKLNARYSARATAVIIVKERRREEGISRRRFMWNKLIIDYNQRTKEGGLQSGKPLENLMNFPFEGNAQ